MESQSHSDPHYSKSSFNLNTDGAKLRELELNAASLRMQMELKTKNETLENLLKLI